MSDYKKNSAIFFIFLFLSLFSLICSLSLKKENIKLEKSYKSSKGPSYNSLNLNQTALIETKLTTKKNKSTEKKQSTIIISENIIDPDSTIINPNLKYKMIPAINPDKDHFYSQATDIDCSDKNCNYPNFCSKDKKVCICNFEFAEFDLYQSRRQKSANYSNSTNEIGVNNSGKVYCNYKRKNQIVYFLLEFLLNCGAGHFYAKNYLLSAFKIGLIVIPWIILIFLLLTAEASNCLNTCSKNISFFGFILIFFSIVWWIIDSFLIGLNVFSDGNGVPLLFW